MAQVNIPEFLLFRRRTRTYDTPTENTEAVIKAISALLAPAGTFIPTALETDPEGGAWLICDGRAISKADFPRLFAILGDRYGATTQTFNLPDLRGRMMMGAGAGLAFGATAGQTQITLTEEQLPSHTHELTDPGHTHAFAGDPHNHALTDPGHSHTALAVGAAPDALTGDDQITAETGGTTGSATTGITLADATAGGTNETSETGISIGSTGEGAPVDITPPVFGINWMIRT